MKTFQQYLTEASEGDLAKNFQYKLTSLADGSHIVAAYHPDHKGQSVHGYLGMNSALKQVTKPPKGMSHKNLVGHAYIGSHGYSVSVEVHPHWRRKGVATALYHNSEKYTGKPLAPAKSQSDDAINFWKTYKHVTECV